MIRILLISALLMPFPAMSFKSITTDSTLQLPQYKTITYGDSIGANIQTLSKCKDADIPILFHDEYIESHSAVFISNAVEAINDCEVQNIDVKIWTEDVQAIDGDNLPAQQIELIEYFKAYGLSHKVSYSYTDEVDTMSLNGRTASIGFRMETPVNYSELAYQ